MEGFKGRTPPWHYDEELSGVYSASCRFVCDVTDKNNGILIAAAPELLEALQSLIEACSNLGYNGGGQEELYIQVERAESAINKALGGE